MMSTLTRFQHVLYLHSFNAFFQVFHVGETVFMMDMMNDKNVNEISISNFLFLVRTHEQLVEKRSLWL